MAVDLSAGLSSPAPAVDLTAGLVGDSQPAAQSSRIDLSAGLSLPPPARVDLSAGLSGDAPPQGQPQPRTSTLDFPDRVSIAPYQPSIWERIKSVFTEGNPNYSTQTVYSPTYGRTQLLTPEAALTPSEQKAHPIATGVAEFSGGLTSPTSVGLMAATGGLGELPGAASALPRLISAGFSAQSVYQAAQQFPQIKAAIARGDTSEAERLLTHAVLNLGMGALGARHAASGNAAVSGKTETESPATEATTPAVETRVTEPHSPVSEVLHEQAPDVRVVDSTAAKDHLLAEDTLHGGHAGNGVASAEEVNRPGANYIVGKTGSLTYHGKSFAPEETPADSTHVSVLPDGTFRVNAGNDLSSKQLTALREGTGNPNLRAAEVASPWGNLKYDAEAQTRARQELGADADPKAVLARAQQIKQELMKPTAQIVSDDHVPVVSRNEVLAQAVQTMVNNSDELAKLGIDPSKITSPADADAMLQQAADHIKTNLDPRASATLTFDMQKALASELSMTVEDLLSRKSGQAFNAEQAIGARALLNDSGLNVVKAAQRAVADSSALSDMTTALAQHQAILDSVKGMTAEAGRSLGSFRVQDLPASRIANAMAQLPEDAQAKAAQLLAKIDPNNPRQLNDFVEKITPSSTADKIFEFYRNSLLSGPATVIKKGVSEATMMALEIAKKVVAGGLSKLPGGDEQRYASESYWFAKGAIDAMQHAKSVLTGQFDLADEPDFEKSGQQAIKGIAGDIIRFPSTVLSRQTNLMYALNYFGELNSQAARQAISEGLSGNELAARQEYLVAHPSEAMTKTANDVALHNTFQKNLGTFAKKVQSTIQAEPTGALRYLVPFFKTPINIAKEAGYYSPYGLFKGKLTGDLDMQARGIVGSSIAAGIGYLALNNLISGGGPIQPSKRETLEASGWQPYGVRIGDRWISYRRAEPLGLSLALVADAVHGMKSGDPEVVSNSKVDTALAHIARSLQDVAFVPTLASLSEAITNPDARGKNFIAREVAGFIPAGVKDIAQGVDRTVRKPEGVAQTVESRVPGLTAKVPPAIDITGRPAQRPASELGGANPFPVSTQKNDPVVNELARLGVSTSPPPPSIKWRGRQTQLLDSERQMLQEQEGSDFYRRVSRVISSPGWQRLPDEEKRSRVKQIKRDIEGSRAQRIARFMNQTQASLKAGSL